MGQKVVVSPYRKTAVSWGKKLLMNTENLWKTGGMMPPGPTVVLGEDDVLSPAVDHFSGPAAWMYKQNLDGHRDLGCSVVAFYGGVCPSRRGWMLQQFILPDMVHHGYSGSIVTRDYSLHNDLYVPARLRLEWRMLAPTAAWRPRAKICTRCKVAISSGARSASRCRRSGSAAPVLWT